MIAYGKCKSGLTPIKMTFHYAYLCHCLVTCLLIRTGHRLPPVTTVRGGSAVDPTESAGLGRHLVGRRWRSGRPVP